MSRLVIMEGWINQKKNNEVTEVYAVLTKTHLKIYKSQINYKHRPDETLKVLNLSDAYNILPMSFDNNYTFSIFKKGEKAADRLYLCASSKVDYESWLNLVEGVLNQKPKEEESNSTINVPVSIIETKPKLDTVDKTISPKPTYKIRSANSFTTDNSELKKLQEKYTKLEEESQKSKKYLQNLVVENETVKKDLLNCEKELTKIKENYEKSIKEQENQSKTISSKSVEEIRKLKLDKQQINDKKISLEKEMEDLKKSIKDNNDINETHLNDLISKLTESIKSESIDIASYMYCIDTMIDRNKPSSIFEILLKKQLQNLVHKCPIDLKTNISLQQYLSVNLDLSQTSIIQFLSKLIISFTNTITKNSMIKSDLDPNIMSLIKNVVTMTKIPQKIESPFNFNQTLMEICYLLTKKINFKTPISNGVVDTPNDINTEFDNFLRSYNIDQVTKLSIVELGSHIKEIYQSRLEDKENILKKPQNTKTSDPILHSYLNKKWNETLRKLGQKDQEIKDLYITIEQLSSRILTLECELENGLDRPSYDDIINIYSLNADILCPTCQTQAANLLEVPMVKQINKMISDFQSYWRTLLSIHSALNTKQQFNSGLREIFDKMSLSIQDYDLLMKQLSQLTQRKIENPSLQKTSSVLNDR